MNGSTRTLLDDTELPDSALIQRIVQNDEDALLIFYARHSQRVYSVAFRILRDRSAAEDVRQEIFMQVWSKPDRFASVQGSLASWMAATSRNRSIDMLRIRRPSETLDDVQISSSSNVSEQAEENVLYARARRLILLLPNEQRHLVEMAFVDDMTHAEIAEATKFPLGTIKGRIRAGLTTLRLGFTPAPPKIDDEALPA